jgi:hypothetical protein
MYFLPLVRMPSYELVLVRLSKRMALRQVVALPLRRGRRERPST